MNPLTVKVRIRVATFVDGTYYAYGDSESDVEEVLEGFIDGFAGDVRYQWVTAVVPVPMILTGEVE